MRCCLLLLLAALSLCGQDTIQPHTANLVFSAETSQVTLQPASRLLYPAELVDPEAGQLTLRLAPGALHKEARPLVSIGENNPVWWLLAITGQELSLLLENRGTMTLPGTYYIRLTCVLDDWQPGDWLEVGFAWERRQPGHSRVQLLVDGEVRDEREDVDLPPSLGKAAKLGLGCNTANANAPAFTGRIDWLRIMQPEGDYVADFDRDANLRLVDESKD